MWILESEKTGKKHFLLANKEYTVGRKDADILITDDPSISRKHAVLQISHVEGNLNNPERQATVSLRDENSKYGTFVNGKQVKAEKVLKEDDVITFGQLQNNFKLLYKPLVVTASSLNSATKDDLRNVLLNLGGHLLSDWRGNCTHLVMSEIKITVKAVCAMVALKPLVLPNYFRDLLEMYKNSGKEVFPKDYIPPLGEDSLMEERINFSIVPERATLFCNKTFIFFSKKQYKKLMLPISLAKGYTELFDIDEPVNEKKLLSENTCVIQDNYENTQLRKLVADMEGKLRNVDRRMIPESDIGLAVIYCSTDKFCNPKVKSDFMQPSQLLPQTLSQEGCFVPETQTVAPTMFDDCHFSQMSVPETVFCTQQQMDRMSDSDEESTPEVDDSLKRRFRVLSSDETTNIPSPKYPRIDRESCATGSVSVKVETKAKDEMMDWALADTQPLPTQFTQMISHVSESQTVKTNDSKSEESFDMEDADTLPLPVTCATSQELVTEEPEPVKTENVHFYNRKVMTFL